MIINDLRIPIGHAIEIARNIEQDCHYRSPGGITLSFDTALIRTRLSDRLAHAVEIAPIPKRGRPEKTKRGASIETPRQIVPVKPDVA
jgi:hypothetical protein